LCHWLRHFFMQTNFCHENDDFTFESWMVSIKWWKENLTKIAKSLREKKVSGIPETIYKDAHARSCGILSSEETFESCITMIMSLEWEKETDDFMKNAWAK